MTMRYVHPAEEHKREAAGKIENFKAASAMKTMRVEDCNSLRRLVGAWRFELQTSCAQGRRLKPYNHRSLRTEISFVQFTVVASVVSDLLFSIACTMPAIRKASSLPVAIFFCSSAG
jgi:hypothetical protein